MPILTVDIGGTNIRICLVNERGEILEKQRSSTPKTVEEIIEKVLDFYTLRKANISKVGVGLSVAGAFLRMEDSLWLPNALGGSKNKLHMKLEEALGIPVVPSDDRESSVLGECWKGTGEGKKDVALLIAGTGLGLGIISNGSSIVGNNGLAGSLGWLKTEDNQRLEDAIAGPGIIDSYFKETGERVAGAALIFERAKNGQESAITVLKRVAKDLGKALAIIANLFDPEIIALSGSVLSNWEYLKEEAMKNFINNASPLKKDVGIKLSNLGEDAPILGAAWNVLIHGNN